MPVTPNLQTESAESHKRFFSKLWGGILAGYKRSNAKVWGKIVRRPQLDGLGLRSRLSENSETLRVGQPLKVALSRAVESLPHQSSVTIIVHKLGALHQLE